MKVEFLSFLVTEMAQVVEIQPHGGQGHVCPLYLNFFLMNDKGLFIIQGEYFGWWWPADVRSQGISSYGDQGVLVYSCFNNT